MANQAYVRVPSAGNLARYQYILVVLSTYGEHIRWSVRSDLLLQSRRHQNLHSCGISSHTLIPTIVALTAIWKIGDDILVGTAITTFHSKPKRLSNSSGLSVDFLRRGRPLILVFLTGLRRFPTPSPNSRSNSSSSSLCRTGLGFDLAASASFCASLSFSAMLRLGTSASINDEDCSSSVSCERCFGDGSAGRGRGEE